MVTIIVTIAVLVMVSIFSCVFIVAFSTWHMTKRKQMGTQPPEPQIHYQTQRTYEDAEVIEIN